MSAKDFEFVNLAPAEELPAVMNRQRRWHVVVGAVAAQVVTDQHPDKFHVIGTSSVDTYEGNMITTMRRKFAEEGPGSGKLYLRSLIELAQQIKAHESEAIDIYARKLRTSREEAEEALHDYTIGVWLDDRVIKTLIEVSEYVRARAVSTSSRTGKMLSTRAICAPLTVRRSKV